MKDELLIQFIPILIPKAPSSCSVLFCFVSCFFFVVFFNSVIVKEEKKKTTVKVCFFPLFQGILLCQIQRKTDLNGKDLNRLTEQKTGEDVNRNKLVTGKKERRGGHGTQRERG